MLNAGQGRGAAEACHGAVSGHRCGGQGRLIIHDLSFPQTADDRHCDTVEVGAGFVFELVQVSSCTPRTGGRPPSIDRRQNSSPPALAHQQRAHRRRRATDTSASTERAKGQASPPAVAFGRSTSMGDASRNSSSLLRVQQCRPWPDTDRLPVCAVVILWVLSVVGVSLLVALLMQGTGVNALMADGICLSRLGIWLAPPVLFWGIIGGAQQTPASLLTCKCVRRFTMCSSARAINDLRRACPALLLSLPGLLAQAAIPSTVTSSGTCPLWKARMSSTSFWRQ
jgi:hypothetical protein